MSTEPTAATGGEQTTSADDTPDQATSSPDELRGRIELLQAENQRLRQEYVRARQSRYQRTAAGLFVVGVLGLAGGLLLPGPKSVLVALGGSAVVAGALTYYLTPEDFVTLSVGEALTTTLQDSYESIQAELNLAGDPVYIPLTDSTTAEARLFLPQHHDYTIPSMDALRDVFVVPEEPDQRGLALYPAGSELLSEFQQTSTIGTLSRDDPKQVFEALSDGLVEQFEFADQISTTLEGESRCVIAVRGSKSDGVHRLDHPLTSFLGVGAAAHLQAPIHVEVNDADGSDYIIECRWEKDESAPTDGTTG
jgi:uncharacterized small protein (DUF1192 family)